MGVKEESDEEGTKTVMYLMKVDLILIPAILDRFLLHQYDAKYLNLQLKNLLIVLSNDFILCFTTWFFTHMIYLHKPHRSA